MKIDVLRSLYSLLITGGDEIDSLGSFTIFSKGSIVLEAIARAVLQSV
jgi:hypothetical protein